MGAVNPHELHRRARDWALDRLNLSEREDEDRLYDDRGRSYKVKARTAPETGAVTSFDLRDPVPEFDFLVGVQVGADGVTVSEAFVADRATFDDRAHRNQDSVRFRLSASGPERLAVEWLTPARAHRARSALALAERTVRRFTDDRPEGDEWLILWAASLSLLRTVGYALKKVDAASSSRMGEAVKKAWDEVNATKPKPEILWSFIDDIRGQMVHQFDLGVERAGVGVDMTGGGMRVFPTYGLRDIPGFPGARPEDMLRRALRFWEAHIERVESLADSGTREVP